MNITDIIPLLEENPFFGILPQSILKELQEEFRPLSFDLGEDIITEGSPGEAFYIIYSGKARVISESGNKKAITLATLHKGDSFGEQSLLQNRPITKTVRASGKLVLLSLSRDKFADLVEQYPEFKNQLEERIRRNHEVNFLRTLNIFSSLNFQESKEMLSSIRTITLNRSDFLFHEGDPGDAAYVIRKGCIEVLKESSNNLKLATLSQGSLIGEMSLLYSQPRSAGALALEDSVLLCLDQEVFQRITAKSRNFQSLITKQAARRLMQADTLLLAEDTESATDPELRVETVSVGEGILKRHFCLVKVRNPALTGTACLGMIADSYDLDWQPLNILDTAFGGKRESFFSLSRKLESLGFLTRELHLNLDQLGQLTLPAILRKQDSSFAILYHLGKSSTIIGDPILGITEIPLSDFKSSWDSRILSIRAFPETTSRFSWLLKTCGPFLPALTLSALVVQLGACIVPLLCIPLVDRVLLQGHSNLLATLSLGICLAALFQLIGGGLREYLIAFIRQRMNNTSMLLMFRKILKLPYQTISDWKSNKFLRIFQNADRAMRIFSDHFCRILVNILALIAILICLVSLSPPLSLAILVLTSIFVLGSRIPVPIMEVEASTESRRSLAEDFITELVQGIHSLKAMGSEEKIYDKTMDLMSRSELAVSRYASIQESFAAGGRLYQQLGTLTVIGLGLHLTLEASLSTGEFLAFLSLCALARPPLQEVLAILKDLKTLKKDLEQGEKILALKTESDPSSVRAPILQGHIRIEELSFRYPDNTRDPDLNRINLEIFPGEKIGVLGRKGSGKTTLVRLLLRLLPLGQGNIYLDGVDLLTLDPWLLRRQIAHVEGNLAVFSGTLRENIAVLDPAPDFEKVIAASIFAGLHDFIESLPMKYETRIGEGAVTLGDGQRQQLMIARALFMNPSILILDDAMHAIDTEAERNFQHNLETLMSEQTTILLTQRCSTLRRMDRIFVMDQGKIVENGSFDELMQQKGLFYTLNSGSIQNWGR